MHIPASVLCPHNYVTWALSQWSLSFPYTWPLFHHVHRPFSRDYLSPFSIISSLLALNPISNVSSYRKAVFILPSRIFPQKLYYYSKSYSWYSFIYSGLFYHLESMTLSFEFVLDFVFFSSKMFDLIVLLKINIRLLFQ